MGATINEIAKRQILALVESTLIRAGVAGIFPTPLDSVDEVAGVQALVDIGNLPKGLVAAKPSALRRILGAYLYRSETMFVDLSQPVGRARFIRGHETSHRIIPWHRDSYHLDDEYRLSRETEELLEQEANFGATHLLFQGTRFHTRALDYETSIRTPVGLAPEFGTSIHATIRYYVEHHPDPVALVTAGRYARQDGRVPVWDGVESPSFLQRFGEFVLLFPGRSIHLGEDGSPQPFASLAKAALTAVDPPCDTVMLRDLADETAKFTAEVFFNQYCLFVMVSPRHLLRRGRRLRLAAAN